MSSSPPARRERLLIFNNFNRIHVVPPCTITDDEAREGLARLDRAFDDGRLVLRGLSPTPTP